MADCVFCMIGNHEIPSNVVYEDDKIIAFKEPGSAGAGACSGYSEKAYCMS